MNPFSFAPPVTPPANVPGQTVETFTYSITDGDGDTAEAACEVACTACGKCGEAVTTEIPNPWNYGLDKMKAAYLPHAMAYPQRYVLDASLVGTPDADKAKSACKYGAIDLGMIVDGSVVMMENSVRRLQRKEGDTRPFHPLERVRVAEDPTLYADCTGLP